MGTEDSAGQGFGEETWPPVKWEGSNKALIRNEGWYINVGAAPRRVAGKIYASVVYVKFSSDEEAAAFVQKRAAEGSVFHQEALVAAIKLRVQT